MNPIRCRMMSVKTATGQPGDEDPVVNDFLAGVEVSQIFASPGRTHDGWDVLVFYRERSPVTSSGGGERVEGLDAPIENEAPLTPDEQRAYDRLRKWRQEQAVREGLPSYVVAHNRTMKRIVQLPVQSIDDLRRIKGVGEKQVEKYGAAIVQLMTGMGEPMPSAGDEGKG